jgi:L-iditol 2-dehydrogenase
MLSACRLSYNILVGLGYAIVSPRIQVFAGGISVKAVVIRGPRQAEVSSVSEGPLAAGDVRVKVLATGCCGTDVELFEGSMPYLTAGLAKYPVIPGHEWVGEVCEVGAEVHGFASGDRVVGECSCGCMRCACCLAGHYHRCPFRTETGILNRPGAFAEYIHFPAAFLHRISKHVPLPTACLIEPAAVAFNGARRARISPRDDVAIFGDGPIGLLLLMMAKTFGARTVALVGASQRRLAKGAELGTDLIVDVTKEDVFQALDRHGLSPSVILEATGHPASVAAAVRVIAPGGRLVLQGIFAGQKLDGLDLDRIVISEVTVQGALGSPGVWPDVIRLIESGRVNPGTLVSDALSLDQYSQAIERVSSRQGIKTIVVQEA